MAARAEFGDTNVLDELTVDPSLGTSAGTLTDSLVPVFVVGFADVAGNAAYNLDLSRRRAEQVRQSLAAAAPVLSCEVLAQGVDAALTGDLAPAHRVEIRVG